MCREPPHESTGPEVAEDVSTRAAALVAGYKRRTWEWMGACGERRLLDVGCGAGTDTLQLAQHVEEAGRVVGVDRDECALAVARERSDAAGLGARSFHLSADAHRLPFADDAFDGTRSDRVVQHLVDAAACVAEMRRVTRPGGRVVLAESDYGSFSLHTGEPALAERLAGHLFERHLVDAWAGRRLRGLLHAAGFQSVEAEAHPLVVTDVALFRAVSDWAVNRRRVLAEGVAREDELRQLEDDLAASDRAGAFWCSFQVVVARGTVPGNAP